jgi:putative nucleotidyltransferase with HDIG domain
MNLRSNSSASNISHVSHQLDLEAMIKAKLPPLPGSVAKILNLIQDPEVQTIKLAKAVLCDPSLTTRILRLANSPIYYLQRKVTSIQKAIDVIGVRALYDMLMLNLANDSFANEIQYSVIGRMIWEHSLTVAIYSRELSKTIGLRGSEEAFICGLLHDIGKIMLLRAEPEAYSDVLNKSTETELLQWEIETFGYEHGDVGAIVARGWKLPDDVGRVIFDHHKMAKIDNAGIVSHVINVADMVANVNGFGLRIEEFDQTYRSRSMTKLRLESDQLETAWNNVEGSLSEILDMFAAQ